MSLVRGNDVEVKASSIIAGLHAEKTNELLQAIGQAASRGKLAEHDRFIKKVVSKWDTDNAKYSEVKAMNIEKKKPIEKEKNARKQSEESENNKQAGSAVNVRHKQESVPNETNHNKQSAKDNGPVKQPKRSPSQEKSNGRTAERPQSRSTNKEPAEVSQQASRNGRSSSRARKIQERANSVSRCDDLPGSHLSGRELKPGRVLSPTKQNHTSTQQTVLNVKKQIRVQTPMPQNVKSVMKVNSEKSSAMKMSFESVDSSGTRDQKCQVLAAGEEKKMVQKSQAHMKKKVAKTFLIIHC